MALPFKGSDRPGCCVPRMTTSLDLKFKDTEVPLVIPSVARFAGKAPGKAATAGARGLNNDVDV